MQVYHLTLGPIGTNCYLAADENGETAIIDPAANPARINQILEENNLIPKLILLTHGHFDHIGGALGVVKKHPEVKIAIGEQDAPMLPKAIHNRNWQQFITAEDYEGLAADLLLHEGDELQVGSMAFRVMETPGHTRGGVCYLCDNLLFSGDTLFRCECGRTDLDGGDYPTILRSLKRLHDLEGEWQVLPGHEELSLLSYERLNNPYMKEALR